MAIISYTRAKLLADVRLLLEETTAQRFADADIQGWIDESIGFVAAATRSLRQKDETTSSLSGGDGGYTIPSDSVGSWAISEVHYDGTRLEGPVAFDKRYQGVQQGLSPTSSATTPKYWSPFGDKIYLTPPNTLSGKTIAMFTPYLPDTLATSAAVMPLRAAYGPVVHDYVLHRAFMKNGQPQESNTAWQRFMFKLQAVSNKQVADVDPAVARGT